EYAARDPSGPETTSGSARLKGERPTRQATSDQRATAGSSWPDPNPKPAMPEPGARSDEGPLGFRAEGRQCGVHVVSSVEPQLRVTITHERNGSPPLTRSNQAQQFMSEVSENRPPPSRIELLGIEPLEEHARRLAALLTVSLRQRGGSAAHL